MENKKRILITATVVKTHIMQFHIPVLKMFKEMGWETAVASYNDYENKEECQIPFCDRFYELPFARNPFSKSNITAYKELSDIIKKERFDIIHCHTPVGGVITRLAARNARKNGTRVFYTAHGFHFFKGSSIKNWLLFYPAEMVCSYFTDALITINSQDYGLAKRNFHAKETVLVNGVGVDTRKIYESNPDKEAYRKELGLNSDDIMLFSIGELIERKNHKTIIKALSMLNNDNIHYVIAGSGTYYEDLYALTKELGLEEKVHFLGYRRDATQLLKTADVFCFPSYQEGLPVALIEAMSGGMAVVASRIRGTDELIDEGKGGYLYSPDDASGFASGITKLIENPELRDSFASYNIEKAKKYDISIVSEQMKKIYFGR